MREESLGSSGEILRRSPPKEKQAIGGLDVNEWNGRRVVSEPKCPTLCSAAVAGVSAGIVGTLPSVEATRDGWQRLV
ncbi:hypothetical protein ZIOFF_063232 [Zingiber officinale]|uniref:Uncharacterized protein n=1 Tax=Zingiber officinale TaxID=94328 RepID=A0A8J5KG18_ZINOF|nr:hypothetical protein ZIOFF_063232 [Zingiber officinale]